MNSRSATWCAAVLLLTLLCIQPALGIPDSMSYEQYVTLIHDQDSQGGCIGYSALHVLEIQKEIETPYSPDPSYAFLNYVFQSSTQNGADPRVLHNPDETWDSILTNYGLPPETSYGTNFDLLGEDVSTMLAHPPSQTAFSEAQAYRVDSGLTSGYDPSYELWNPTKAQAEEWLATKGPLVCHGLYPGHTVALIGYDHTYQKFTIVDSANWVGIDHAGIKQVSYTYFASRQPNMSLEYAPNRPTPLVHPYTARIRIHHEDRRSQLTVTIGAKGHEPTTVWDRNNRVNYTDLGTDLAIDVPLPAYAAEHWPPSDQNPWYVNVTNHDPDHTAVLQEVTLVRRLEHPWPIPVTCDVYTQKGLAAFTANPVRGLSPLTIQFVDTSTETATVSPTAWHWDFGDGQTSTTKSPSHSYANPGNYTVTHAVTYPGGVTQSITRPSLITVSQSLNAAYTVSSRIGYEPLTVRFTDTSTGNPTSWHWDFGDGEISTEQNPTHTYEGALSGDALYTVTLTVSNPYDTKTATKTDYIRVIPLYGGMIKVEAEDYIAGGEGVAYHDTTAGNSGGAYRSDGVDIITSASGYAVTGIAETEWTKYWVWSPATEPHVYPITLRLSNAGSGNTVELTADGTGDMIVEDVPYTGSTSTYGDLETQILLAPGANLVKIAYHGDRMNFDYLTIDPRAVLATEPDLAVRFASPPSGSVTNRVISVQNSVINFGTGIPGGFSIGFYLSPDRTITPSDTLIGTRWCASLPANSETSVATSLTIPASVPAGTYYLGVIADTTYAVSESDETNNAWCAATSFVLVSSPDIASWTYVPPQSPINRSFTITNLVKNLGTAPAGPFSVGFYLSNDTAITTGDTKVGEWSSPGLDAGAVSSLQQTPITIPASVPAGTYYIGSILDSTSAVTEGNELNNLVSNFAPLILSGAVTVPGGSGLPTDTNADGKYDDVNGNGRRDFSDVVLYFNQMTWISTNEPMAFFDCNGNTRIDFADVVWLFNHL